MAVSFEGQLVPLTHHIVQLRRRPEFTAINQIANWLLQPARSNSLLEKEVVAHLLSRGNLDQEYFKKYKFSQNVSTPKCTCPN